MHPSSSGLFVTWAYFDHTTFPVCVTKPNYDTFTYITVPLVMTPNEVYVLDWGFFLTESMGSLNVVLSYG